MSEKKEHNCIDQERTKTHIEKFGLSVVMLQSTGYLPSFTYSVGLWQTYNHPEIICFGLKTDLMHAIINDVADLIKKGEKIKSDLEYNNIFKDSIAVFLDVDKRSIGDYFGVAIDYYNSKGFPALQLIWTDRNNKFPWESDFQEDFKYFQPLLDRNADFKFREEKNLGVFTTSQFVDQKEPIIRVVHDHDGDWQFLTKDIDFDNAKLVSIEQMTKRDNTLNEIFDLDYGEEAERDEIGGKWIRNKFEETEE